MFFTLQKHAARRRNRADRVTVVCLCCYCCLRDCCLRERNQAIARWRRWPGVVDMSFWKFLWTDFLRENIYIGHKMNVGEIIPPLILFPSRKNMKRIRLRGGGGGGGVVHLCFTSASCYVAPYLGLQRALLPSHKSLHQGLLVIKHVLHSVPLSGEQWWKYIVILWPGFKKQCSIYPSANA